MYTYDVYYCACVCVALTLLICSNWFSRSMFASWRLLMVLSNCRYIYRTESVNIHNHKPQKYITVTKYQHTIYLFFEIPRSAASHGEVVHVLLDVDEVLCPLSQLMQHSLVLPAVQ